ncbi:MAG: hypothetical protein AAF651_10920, partial [Cyanobacteria bacterium P01_C01_bin.73]
MSSFRLNFKPLASFGFLTILAAGVSGCTLAQADNATYDRFTDWCTNQATLTPYASYTVDAL